jgi:predicted phage terminase large subunit-like protein
LRAKLAARTEIEKRHAGRTSVLGFATYTWPTYLIGDHHRLLATKLESVERGEIRRLMVFLPPRSGKSEIVSKRFPAWFIGRNPTKHIISASYGVKLAADFGRQVRNILASQEYRALFPDVSLAPDSAAKDLWHTNRGGGYLAAGLETGITGRGADILNIDDPVKDREAADSETQREHAWNWYRSTAYTRLAPGAAIVLTMTRWHPDDLAGRLLQEAEASGDQWDVLSLPAINDRNEALWPARYSRDDLRRIEAAIGPREWNALYQQDPRPGEGALFKAALIGTLDAEPAGRAVRAWDLAATAQVGTRDPDWTVGLKLIKTVAGQYVVADIVRLRGGPDEVEAAVKATASRDGKSVTIGLPQDPGQAGKGQVLYYTKRLAGYRVISAPETGAKETRAGPVASQANVGNLFLVRGAWNATFIDELRGFPSVAHDDQVDALSHAFGLILSSTSYNIANMT